MRSFRRNGSGWIGLCGFCVIGVSSGDIVGWWSGCRDWCVCSIVCCSKERWSVDDGGRLGSFIVGYCVSEISEIDSSGIVFEDGIGVF